MASTQALDHIVRKMTEALINEDATTFKALFAELQIVDDDEFSRHCLSFLRPSVEQNLPEIVEYLLSQNFIKDAESFKSLTLCASEQGNYKILKSLLSSQNKKFKFETDDSLAKICKKLKKDPCCKENVKYQKCFELLLDQCYVNETEYIKQDTPLHYATQYKNINATIRMLQKGTYIGCKNVYGVTPIAEMQKEALETFLNGCINAYIPSNQEPDDKENQQKFIIDMSFLRSRTPSDIESSPLLCIAQNHQLCSQLSHPVLTSFISIKRAKMRWIYRGNLLYNLLALLPLIILAVNGHSENTKILAWVGMVLLICREIVRINIRIGINSTLKTDNNSVCSKISGLLKIFRNSFDISNGLTWILIWLSFELLVFDTSTESYCAIVILLGCYEIMQLAGTLPILSMSTNFIIFQTITKSFFKLFLFFMILLFAFSLSFKILFSERIMNLESASSTKSVKLETVSSSMLRVLVMLVGELEMSNLDLHKKDVPSNLIFVAFVLLITIIMFNVLNALAIVDTQEIMEDAEIVDLRQRVILMERTEHVTNCLKKCHLGSISVFSGFTPDTKIFLQDRKINIITLKEAQNYESQGKENIPMDASNEICLEEIKVISSFSNIDSNVREKIQKIIERSYENKEMENIRLNLNDGMELIEYRLKKIEQKLTQMRL